MQTRVKGIQELLVSIFLNGNSNSTTLHSVPVLIPSWISEKASLDPGESQTFFIVVISCSFLLKMYEILIQEIELAATLGPV